MVQAPVGQPGDDASGGQTMFPGPSLQAFNGALKNEGSRQFFIRRIKWMVSLEKGAKHVLY